MNDLIKKIISAEAEAIFKIPLSDNFEEAATLIYTSVHEKGGKLIASGMGKAGQIANNMATTFSSTGTPAVFIHPSDAQHGDLGVIQKNDIMLVISNSGKTREIIELVTLARNLVPKLPILMITGNTQSELSNLVNITIHTGNPREVCLLGLTPTTSTTVMTVIGDILMVLLMEKTGFTSEAYAKRHHGGYLGDKSRAMLK